MPESKKNQMRFSLSMNENDPVQAAAARVLNSKGRSISEFVAQAVIAYLGGNPNEIYLEKASISSVQTEKADAPQPLSKPSKSSPPATEYSPKSPEKAPGKSQANEQKTMLAMLDGMGDLL